LAENIQALAQSNARLEQASRVKDQFLSMASHELRTPLTSMQGHLQLLLRRLKRQSAQNPEWLPVYDSLGKVDEQTRRLTALVNDLLDINILRSGKVPVRLAPCDLCVLCRGVVEGRSALTGRQIDLNLSFCPLMLQADEGRLSQVTINLVSNALKYSSANTVIRVEVSQRAGEAILAVHNEGPVLSKEQQEAIFEPFYRSPDAQSSAVPGWGLGLAISKEIITQHGGRLWVESSKEKGTTFFAALPLSTNSESV
jgi:signal transduction histidine kinase